MTDSFTVDDIAIAFLQPPNFIFRRCDNYPDTGGYQAALEASYFALEKLAKDQPIRADVGDLQAICGQQLNDQKVTLEGQSLSFESKPNLVKLVMLYQKVHFSEQKSSMQKASELIRTYKQRMKDYSKSERWSGNRIESLASPDSSLLMHAYLFSHNYEDAFKLAQQGDLIH